MKKIKYYLKENVQFYFMRKAYILGIMFFPRIKGYFGMRAEIRLGFGFFAVGVVFGKNRNVGG